MNADRPAGEPGGGVAVTAAGDGVVIPGPTGQSMTVKVSGAASRGAYSLIEYSHAPGAPGPPAHLHREHEEAFYVLEGELTLEAGESSVTVRAGQAAVVPRGVIHRPSNASDQPVRFVFVSSPPMDDFFAELGLLTERGGGRLNAGVLAELGRRYDTVFPGLPTGSVTIRNETR